MKHLIILFFIVSTPIFCQTAKYGEIKKKTKYKNYISKEGKNFKVGDTITIGKPSLGDRFAFITQGGENVAAWLNDNKVIIHKIKSLGSNPLNYKVYFSVKGYGLIEVLIDYEAAYDAFEIVE